MLSWLIVLVNQIIILPICLQNSPGSSKWRMNENPLKLVRSWGAYSRCKVGVDDLYIRHKKHQVTKVRGECGEVDKTRWMNRPWLGVGRAGGDATGIVVVVRLRWRRFARKVWIVVNGEGRLPLLLNLVTKWVIVWRIFTSQWASDDTSGLPGRVYITEY